MLWRYRLAHFGACLATAFATLFSSPLLGQTPTNPPAADTQHSFGIEAEHFATKGPWQVIANGQGNLMVDITGFNHISGEKLLSLPADSQGTAETPITITKEGKYRLWVRYEYPAFCDASFELEIRQVGLRPTRFPVGTMTSQRYSLGQPKPKAQHDPANGSEGLVEEGFTLEGLKPGKATILLHGKKIEAKTGRASPRNIDLIWITSDIEDAWRGKYGRANGLYPILDAFRDTIGARWEARVKNLGKDATSYSINHTYNRLPWGANEAGFANDVAAANWSSWYPLSLQDTCHFHMTTFRSGRPGPFELELRPAQKANIGTNPKLIHSFQANNQARIFIPPYPDPTQKPFTAEAKLAEIVKSLNAADVKGKAPTLPFCYGGWLPLGQNEDYGMLYAKLYQSMGFRSWHPSLSGPKVTENLASVGIEPSRTLSISQFRNPPTTANIDRAKIRLKNAKQDKNVLWFDYGDEIEFTEWIDWVLQNELERLNRENKRPTEKEVLTEIWKAWLAKRRKTIPITEFWVGDWGPFNHTRMRPDTSPRIAEVNPRLYIDSQIFYEEIAMAFAADGARKVKAAFGQDTLCGCNWSLNPFYLPSLTRTMKWFKSGAADFGRHSGYFWQVGQAGPLVNGFIAEHFRQGLSHRDGGVLRQYVMPHAPGNTDKDFLRTGYTQLAHGATMLDFFGIGLNETFTENHIDHRQLGRFKAIKELTHAVGFVEDLLPGAKPVSTRAAIIASNSTERWDLAPITRDRLVAESSGPSLRKIRLHHHLDRLGLWTGLTLLGSSPDILDEGDCTPEKLKDYKLVVLVGDSLPPELSVILTDWTSQGGTLVATAGTGRFDPYKERQNAFHPLLGIESRASETTNTYLRPRADLPFETPHDYATGEGFKIPCFATREQITPTENATVLARSGTDNSPLLIVTKMDKGKVYYCGFHPGIALLWKALQPPKVPDGGPGVHAEVTDYDPATLDLLRSILAESSLPALIESDNILIDRRLLRSTDGFLIPLANYSTKTSPFTLLLRTGFPVKRISSSRHGALSFAVTPDGIKVTHPGTQTGDILRLDP